MESQRTRNPKNVECESNQSKAVEKSKKFKF